MNNNGFSLIEACIALIIIGLLIAAPIQEYNDEVKKMAVASSTTNSLAVKSAIEAYYKTNGFYPCPADLTLKQGDPNYGRGICPPSSLLPGTCSGVCVASADAPATGRIIYGGVPFADLKLSIDKTLDGWSRKLSYAVTETMTGPAATFPADGILNIQTIDSSEAVAVLTTVGHYIIFSHGQNGRGAFNADGVNVVTEALIDGGTGEMLSPCTPDVDNDSENCDNDGLFIVTSRRSTATGARYIDDIATYANNVPTDLWDVDAGNDTYTMKSVGINTLQAGVQLDSSGAVVLDGSGDPIPYGSAIALDVNGKIRASNARTGAICDVDGTDCFSTDVLSGSGHIDCTPSGGGLSGIADANERCVSGLQVGATGNCSSGEVATGVVAGVIQCATP